METGYGLPASHDGDDPPIVSTIVTISRERMAEMMRSIHEVVALRAALTFYAGGAVDRGRVAREALARTIL
jgi:hypothetical protein